MVANFEKFSMLPGFILNFRKSHQVSITVVDFSFEKCIVVLLDKGIPGTSREIYSEDADDGTRTHNP